MARSLFWRDNARFDEHGYLVTTDKHYLEDPFLKYLPGYTMRQSPEAVAASGSKVAAGKMPSLNQNAFASQVGETATKMHRKLHARSATIGLLVGSVITYAATLF